MQKPGTRVTPGQDRNGRCPTSMCLEHPSMCLEHDYRAHLVGLWCFITHLTFDGTHRLVGTRTGRMPDGSPPTAGRGRQDLVRRDDYRSCPIWHIIGGFCEALSAPCAGAQVPGTAGLCLGAWGPVLPCSVHERCRPVLIGGPSSPLPCAAPGGVLGATGGADLPSEQRTQNLGEHPRSGPSMRGGLAACGTPRPGRSPSSRDARRAQRCCRRSCGCNRTSTGWSGMVQRPYVIYVGMGGAPDYATGLAALGERQTNGRAASSTSTGPSQVPYPAGTPPPTRSRCACRTCRRTPASRPTGRWPISTSTTGVSRSSCNSDSQSRRADRPPAGTRTNPGNSLKTQ